MSDAMSDAVGLLSHSELKRRRKAGTITEPELARLRTLEAEAQQRLRSKAKESQPLTREDRISIIEKRIQDPNLIPRDLKSLSRELALLKGESKPYARNVPEQKERDRNLAKQSNSLPRGWNGLAPILIERRALGLPVFEDCAPWSIHGLSIEFLEHQLDVYEVKMAAERGLSSVDELRQYIRWRQTDSEPCSLDCAEAKQAELQKREMELSHVECNCNCVFPLSHTETCAHWVAWIERLKIGKYSLNACGPLRDSELQSVVLARAQLAAEKATWRTAEQMAIERFRKESASI